MERPATVMRKVSTAIYVECPAKKNGSYCLLVKWAVTAVCSAEQHSSEVGVIHELWRTVCHKKEGKMFAPFSLSVHRCITYWDDKCMVVSMQIIVSQDRVSQDLIFVSGLTSQGRIQIWNEGVLRCVKNHLRGQSLDSLKKNMTIKWYTFVIGLPLL